MTKQKENESEFDDPFLEDEEDDNSDEDLLDEIEDLEALADADASR